IVEGQKISRRSMFGVLLGILGIYLLTSETTIVHSSEYFMGIVVIFAAIFSWGYGSIFVAKAELPKSPFINSGFQMLFSGILLLLISLCFGEDWRVLTTISWKAIYSMAILIFFGSLVAFTSFNYLLKKVST